MTGGVGILNVGAGDTKLSFDPSNPAEAIRAARIVRDMLRRGYALMIEVRQPSGAMAYQRVHDFDETKAEYIIADYDPGNSERANEETGEAEAGSPPAPSGDPKPARPRGRPKRVAVPAETVRAVAVARTAGG